MLRKRLRNEMDNRGKYYWVESRDVIIHGQVVVMRANEGRDIVRARRTRVQPIVAENRMRASKEGSEDSRRLKT